MATLTHHLQSHRERFFEDRKKKAGMTRIEIVPTLREGGLIPGMVTFK